MKFFVEQTPIKDSLILLLAEEMSCDENAIERTAAAVSTLDGALGSSNPGTNCTASCKRMPN